MRTSSCLFQMSMAFHCGRLGRWYIVDRRWQRWDLHQDCVGLISNGLQIATTIGAVLLKPTGLIVLAEVHGRLEDWANADKLLVRHR